MKLIDFHREWTEAQAGCHICDGPYFRGCSRCYAPGNICEMGRWQGYYDISEAEAYLAGSLALPVSLHSRFRGAMLGMAVGDAIGTTVEFRGRGTFPPMTDMIGGGAFKLKAGQWTDDTSMALCLAESLIKRKGFDPAHQIDLYLSWYHHGHNSSVPGVCVDIGNATRKALRLWGTRKQYPDDSSHDPYCGDTDQYAAGNGCIMRMAPIALYAYNGPPQDASWMARMSSRTTHASPQCLDGTEVMAGLLRLILAKTPKAQLPTAWLLMYEGRDLHPDIRQIVEGSYLHRPESLIRGSGYVADCLEAAMWSFWHTDNFDAAVLKAVNLGDDADTTGAVVGQIAGAYYGEDNIRASWREKVALRKRIEDYADKLYQLGGF